MKAVMISIRPEWVAKILSGEKTIEVRKTAPKIETPFKCYIYCTLSGSNELFRETMNGDVAEWNRGKWSDRKGNVVAEFVCDKISIFRPKSITCDHHIRKASCVSLKKLIEYANTKNEHIYAWKISNPVIYGKPKELSEFTPHCRYMSDDMLSCNYREVACNYQVFDHNPWPDCSVNAVTCKRRMKRPPQSWCYVEELQ